MATAALSIDVLSVSDRKIVTDALKLRLSSLSRAVKSSTNEAVQKALCAEIVEVEHLMSKFR